MEKKLYEKLPNGRYVEYKEPKIEDRQVYRKGRGNKYYPVGCLCPHDDHLTEGVWVVTRGKGHKCITSGEYLIGKFKAQKVCNLEKLNIAQLGMLEKVCSEVFREMKEIIHKDGYLASPEEAFCVRVAEVIGRLNKTNDNGNT